MVFRLPPQMELERGLNVKTNMWREKNKQRRLRQERRSSFSLGCVHPFHVVRCEKFESCLLSLRSELKTLHIFCLWLPMISDGAMEDIMAQNQNTEYRQTCFRRSHPWQLLRQSNLYADEKCTVNRNVNDSHCWVLLFPLSWVWMHFFSISVHQPPLFGAC